MAIFSNQATLTYNGSSTNSNIAYGEILDVLVATNSGGRKLYSRATGDLCGDTAKHRQCGTHGLNCNR